MLIMTTLLSILCVVSQLLCCHRAHEYNHTASNAGAGPDRIVLEHELTYSLDELSEAQLGAVRSCLTHRDAMACYQIGKALASESSIFGDRNMTRALLFFMTSCERNHAMACNAIGRAFYLGSASDGIPKSDRKALHYFNQSAILGHQGAMYNLGLILTNGNSQEDLPVDIIGSLECFKSSHLYGSPGSLYYSLSTPETTAAAKTAHDVVSDLIAANSHHVFDQQSLLRLWNASSLHLNDEDFRYISRGNTTMISSDERSVDAMYLLWRHGVHSLISFDRTFRQKGGVLDEEVLSVVEEVVAHLGAILQHNSNHLTKLQLHLVLDNLQDAMGTLAGRLDEYVHRAGELAEAMALSHYCRGKFAVWEADSACFNGAISSAMSYYRRANDSVAAMRVFLVAQEHPYASTHWRHIVQTPRVYHKALRASPWWDAASFRLTGVLQDMFGAVGEGGLVQQQLDDLIALRAGSLRDVRTSDVAEAILNRTADHQDDIQETANGLRHIFTPFIGVREDSSRINRTKKKDQSTGGWAEFGPLFNGIEWSASHCSVLPIICSTLQRYIQNRLDNELCGIHSGTRSINASSSDLQLKRTIEMRCGSDTIVTVLRLRPGTHILPHCGTTNRRLIMHFVLRGAESVAFRVGDGLHYGGAVDELQQDATGTATATSDGHTIRRRTAYRPLLSDKVDGAGWMHSYGGSGEDGLAVVFDDSFEHEVVHRGNHDRYVVLLVLKHPDVHYEDLLCKVLAVLSVITAACSLIIGSRPPSGLPQSSLADDLGANVTSNTKIMKGGASTLQRGIAKSITRGVNLDNSDFSNQNLKGVAFQQSIVRDSSFKNTNLYSASFFDATCDGSDFENADMTLANIELAQFNRANFKNTIIREAYVVGTTRFEGIASIENSDWTDTDLRADQRKYLCSLPSAKGSNSKTGASTRESLLCDDL